ncbi:hypothetical protein TIFTF001_002838 [Ficus carica]|uniref:Uncharacterized protein n=1 Tax=Ficus carica TaxID=3494 RepID=A0AA87ZPR2_FICCA|nr:hypothetical protein TIFTF001_002838 [Ficus carica]
MPFIDVLDGALSLADRFPSCSFSRVSREANSSSVLHEMGDYALQNGFDAAEWQEIPSNIFFTFATGIEMTTEDSIQDLGSNSPTAVVGYMTKCLPYTTQSCGAAPEKVIRIAGNCTNNRSLCNLHRKYPNRVTPSAISIHELTYETYFTHSSHGLTK